MLQMPARIRIAVVALVVLAERENRCSRPVPLAEIALLRQLSQNYLEQLFCRLRRAGLVASARGPGGGYRLARPPNTVVIADIIQAMEEPEPKADLDPEPCECTRDLWSAMNAHLRGFLQQVTLEDVLRQRVLLEPTPHTPEPRA
jgi:Rrf2 family transcriptional regulator, iron-sulfur cluster assembly transcription factor